MLKHSVFPRRCCRSQTRSRQIGIKGWIGGRDERKEGRKEGREERRKEGRKEERKDDETREGRKVGKKEGRSGINRRK
jgi:hypothetical protein